MSSGFLLTLLLNASLWGGVALAVGSWFPRLPTLDRVFATAVLGFVLILMGMEALSLVGSIGVAGALGISGFALAVGVAALGKRGFANVDLGENDSEPRERLTGAASLRSSDGSGSGDITPLPRRFLACTALFFAAWAALAFLLRGFVFPVETVSDGPIYHLFFAIRWWKSGHMQLVPTPFGELAATYFPANGDVWLCWLVVGSGSELPAKVGQWPFLLLGAAAIYGLGRLVGAGRSAAIFPAALWTSVPAVLAFSPVANVDLIFTAFYLIAVYFLLEYWRECRTETLALAALACGVAIGTKAVGLVLVVPVVLFALVAAIRGHNRVRHVGLLVGCLALPCAYWFARNVYWTGNPLYPLHVGLFEHTLLTGWYDRQAMRNSAYHLSPADWRALVDRFTAVVDLRLAWLWPVALLGGLAVVFIRSPKHHERWAAIGLSGLALVLFVVYWFVIPYNTQERFLLPALGMGLVPLALLVKDRWWFQAALVGLLAWHLLGPQWQTQLLLNGSTRGAVLLPWDGGRLSGGAAGFGLALPLSLLVGWIVFESTGRARWLLSGAVVAAGCSMAVWPAVSVLRQRPELRFYPITHFAPNLFPAWLALEKESGPEGSRVAYTGTNLPYYLFGQGLRNEVHYVNVNGPADWLLQDYYEARLRAGRTELSSDPWPEWYRENPDYEAWLENLRRAGIEYLFVARENRHGKRDVPPGLPPFPIERRWAGAHPEVFSPIPLQSGPADSWVALYRVKGPGP